MICFFDQKKKHDLLPDLRLVKVKHDLRHGGDHNLLRRLGDHDLRHKGVAASTCFQICDELLKKIATNWTRGETANWTTTSSRSGLFKCENDGHSSNGGGRTETVAERWRPRNERGEEK